MDTITKADDSDAEKTRLEEMRIANERLVALRLHALDDAAARSPIGRRFLALVRDGTDPEVAYKKASLEFAKSHASKGTRHVLTMIGALKARLNLAITPVAAQALASEAEKTVERENDPGRVPGGRRP